MQVISKSNFKKSSHIAEIFQLGMHEADIQVEANLEAIV